MEYSWLGFDARPFKIGFMIFTKPVLRHVELNLQSVMKNSKDYDVLIKL